MHHDAARSTCGGGLGRRVAFAFGHNWVVLSIWVPYPWNPLRGLAVPVLFRLYRSKKLCPVADYRKRTELAAEMVATLRTWLPQGRALNLSGDREYGCRRLRALHRSPADERRPARAADPPERARPPPNQRPSPRLGHPGKRRPA
jgi:hypothetical protein